MAFNSVFVTVGTTRFDRLINIITNPNVLKLFKEKGCKRLIIQIGKGKAPMIEEDFGMEIEIFRLRESIEDEILRADLIIGHAGAGTCLQSLQAGKRLIVVVNEDLMDNHQSELADRFFDEGYLHVATCSDLVELIDSNLADIKLNPYPKGNVGEYVNFIDNMMGFVV